MKRWIIILAVIAGILLTIYLVARSRKKSNTIKSSANVFTGSGATSNGGGTPTTEPTPTPTNGGGSEPVPPQQGEASDIDALGVTMTTDY